ncbi:MAG: GNAT family N-acetyltransferase [Clostridiales bacterium]|nr:GNAT family N-acetyltransferase [Clostridiales bacterium]
MGIGRMMIKELKAKYDKPLEAETDDDAVGFYRKCGFETAEIARNGIRRWICKNIFD